MHGADPPSALGGMYGSNKHVTEIPAETLNSSTTAESPTKAPTVHQQTSESNTLNHLSTTPSSIRSKVNNFFMNAFSWVFKNVRYLFGFKILF